jgi:hypothetical protein
VNSIDGIGQFVAQLREKLLAGHAGARCQLRDLIRAKCGAEIVRRDLLVRARTDPGIRGVAMAVLLELLEQVAEAAC